MKTIKKTLGLGALVFSLAAGFSCAPPITSGKVIEKKYEPVREYVKRGTRFIRIGKVNHAMPYSHDMIDDEDYIITFGADVDGKFRNRTVYVSKEVYNSLSIEDNFDAEKIPHEPSDPDKRK